MPADSADPSSSPLVRRSRQAWLTLCRRLEGWSATRRALAWSASAGLLFSVLNAIARELSLQLHPYESQFLRYALGLVVMLPLVARAGMAVYRTPRVGAHFVRGAVHTVGLVLWYLALPRIPLADMTAIGFTAPIFILIGAAIFLSEPMRREHWVASGVGLLGVLVVLGPRLSGQGGWWHLVMLASAPVFAASFLLTKALTRTDSAGVIVVWQSISVALFSLPLAASVWQWPSAAQWVGFTICGVLGSAGHYCLTRSFRSADISATQGAKFLDLLWATLLGWAVFGDAPTASTLIGGAIISAATVWLARRS